MKPNLSSKFNDWAKPLSNRVVTGLKLIEVSYSPGLVTPKHRHENAGFCLVLRGTYTEDYSKKILECTPQTVTFSPAGEEHLNRFHRTAVHCFIIDVEAVWLKRVRQCGVILENPVDFHKGSLVWLATRIYNEYNNMDDASPLVIEALILEMLVGVSRGSKNISERKPPGWLQQARVFIYEHFSQRFSLKEVASAVGIHPIYLASEFRRHYQCTVGEYVRQLRVENACREMIKSETSLVEIALAAGFSSQSHFSSVFKRMTGMTPATYRANALHAAYQKMRENGESFVNRLFIGKAWNKRSLIQMSDAKGRMRLELSVEPNGNPKLNFLDENGKVTYSLPEDAKAKK